MKEKDLINKARHCEPPKAAWQSRLHHRHWRGYGLLRRLTLLAMTLFFGMICAFSYAQDEAKNTANPHKKPVLLMTMDGAIGPAFYGYLESGIKKAESEGAQLIVIQMDTPGGLLSSTRDMVTAILESPVPVALWVTPSGAHAASAGTFILYASHIAAMNEGTNVGAATPIEMKGQLKGQVDEEEKKQEKDLTPEGLQKFIEDMMDPNQKAMRQKSIEDTAAFIRTLAELRNRNAEWAEKAVVEADSITAREALEKGVIDFIAQSLEELLNKVDGKEIELHGNEKTTLQTAFAPVMEFMPDWKTKFMVLLTDPNIAMILMSIGVYGLILEFYNPGSMIPGTIGVISLIIGLYAMNVLPVDAAGIVLLLAGLAFMVAEAFMPSFGIMGFGGLIAFVIGATMMFETEYMPGLSLHWGVIWGIGVLGAISVSAIAFFTARAYRRKISTGTESMIGMSAKVVEWKGDKGRVRIQGEVWSAYADTDLDVSKDDHVFVNAVENLTLKIRAVE